MTATTARVLLIEDMAPDSRLVLLALRTSRWRPFEVEHVTTLAAARERLRATTFDVILADLGLPDSGGVETVRAVRDAAGGAPIVVLTVDDDPTHAAAALEAGAQDYQPKTRLDGEALGRALRYAILRHGADEAREALIRKEAELARAEEVDDVRRRLVALIAHELRTPMTPLVTWLDVIDRSIPETGAPHQRNAITKAKRSSHRLRRLIEDVVLAARASSMGLPLRLQPTELGPLVAQAVAEMAPTSAERRIEVVPMLDGPITADVDADRLLNVLQALLSNAIKFSRVGGRVEVTLAREGPRILLRVKDEGAGIPPDVIPKLFQPFSIGHDALAIPTDARGLDLYLARIVVEGHGGRILAHSEGPDKGATFTVELPGGAPA